MTRALVTGANGHLGAHLVRELLDDGQQVVAFVRAGADLRGLAGVDVELRRGDILDPRAVSEAMTGCDVVHHAASPYIAWARDPDAFLRPAVDGTRNVLRAAREHRVARVVCTSSCNVVGFTDTLERPRDEGHDNDLPLTPYVRSKVAAEREAGRLAMELGVDVVFANPTGILGALDYRVTPTTRLLADLVSGRMPATMGLNGVLASDVARAHRLLAERGRSGERYLIGSDNLSPDTVAAWVADVTGRVPVRTLPPRLVMTGVATLMEAFAAVFGGPPMLTRTQVAEVWGRHLVFDTTKVRREVGFAPRPAAEVLDEAVRWAGFLGILDRRVSARVAQRFPPDARWLPTSAERTNDVRAGA